jgi:hypothetical protein
MTRRRIKVLGGAVCLVALAAVAVIALPASGTAPAGSALYAKLDGEHEIPDRDPDGYGTFTAGFRALAGPNTSFCYGYTVFLIGNPTAAHIHQGGPAVANGPIRVGLQIPTAGVSGSRAACTTISDTQANAIKANPGGYYVNVHNGAYPGGAIRGQLFQATPAQDK